MSEETKVTSEQNQVVDDREKFEFNTNLLSTTFGLDYWDSIGRGWSDITPSTIKNWLSNPMIYNTEVRTLSRWMYNASGIYTNVIDYMVSLPTLDSVIYSRNNKHSRFTKNKELYLTALRKIRHKQIVRDILLKCAIDGVYFGYLDVAGEVNDPQFMSQEDMFNILVLNSEDDKYEENAKNFNATVFALPTDWCQIVGFRNSAYVIAFDLFYFDTMTSNGRALKLRKYPKEIRDKYKEYRSSKDASKRYAILDTNKTICIKTRANREEKWGRPLGLAAFVNMLFEDYFLQTKRNTLDEVNNTIIYQTFPEGKEKGTSALTKTQQKDQHTNIKNALFTRRNGTNTRISFFSIASGTKLEKIDVDTEILKTNMETALVNRICMDLGFAGGALNGESGNFSSHQTNIELVSAEIHKWIEQIVEEFDKVVNNSIINDPQCYVNLYILPTTLSNRDKMVGYMKDLYALGRGSLQAWIASTGFNPEAYIALMDEELALDFDNKYPVHMTSYTASDSEKGEIGRPSNDNPTNENTIKSKTYQKG